MKTFFENHGFSHLFKLLNENCSKDKVRIEFLSILNITEAKILLIFYFNF